MKSLFLLAVGFATTPMTIQWLTSASPGACDAQAYYDGSKWVIDCVSYNCLNDCMVTQLGNPIGDTVPMSCLCPPLNTPHECQSIYWTKPNGVIVAGGCFLPESACQTTKICKDSPPPATTPAPVPAWDACECK
jgi:hypothetical protein